jgi:hypothetical protein
MKPLPSWGSRADAEFLHAVQDGELAPDENYLFLPFGTLLANIFSRSVYRRSCREARAWTAFTSVCLSRALVGCCAAQRGFSGAGFGREIGLCNHGGLSQSAGARSTIPCFVNYIDKMT